MNWFEPVFQDIVVWRDPLLSLWAYLSSVLLAYAAACLILPQLKLRWRLLIGVVFAFVWEHVIPDRPLGFLDGRVGGLQDEVFLVLMLMLIGMAGITLSFFRFRLRTLAPAIAALVVGFLSYTYHVVLANGLDAADREQQTQELVGILSLPKVVYTELCSLELYVCGEGVPNTGHEIFDRELAAWIGNLPTAASGYIASSNGAVTTNPTYVWAAKVEEEGVYWIRKSYEDQTRNLTLAFGIMLVLASSFWFAAALMVEWIHERHWRRKAKAKAQAEPNTV